jgi:quinol---cytochrome-c reductase cytochrome c subunit
MPSFATTLTPEQIQAVADYVSTKIATVVLTGGSLSEGGVLYRMNCSPCHRTDVRGGALAFTKANAPPLTGLDSATIAGAIRTGPGPMPSFPPSVFNDHQLASIVMYARYMQHPPNYGGLPLDYYGPVAEGLVAIITVGVLGLIGFWIEQRGRG